MEGYDFELVENVSRRPGTHRFFGLRNPALVSRVLAWRPDVVHVTGWAWCSHLKAMNALHRKGVPILFRGDSHLLDSTRTGPKWWLKKALLGRIYTWPTAFLVVGSANREYYRAFGVPEDRLFDCPHSIDVRRFAEPAGSYDEEAARWRTELGITTEKVVFLFAGKLEAKKQPLEFMQAIVELAEPTAMGVLVGNGAQEREIQELAGKHPDLFRVLPFQNQSRMPIVYRLGDVFVLPSAYDETWGLAVNEALACGRPVLVSDHVGCAQDVVNESCGRTIPLGQRDVLVSSMRSLVEDSEQLSAMRRGASLRARAFDVGETERMLIHCLESQAWM